MDDILVDKDWGGLVVGWGRAWCLGRCRSDGSECGLLAYGYVTSHPSAVRISPKSWVSIVRTIVRSRFDRVEKQKKVRNLV